MDQTNQNTGTALTRPYIFQVEADHVARSAHLDDDHIGMWAVCANGLLFAVGDEGKAVMAARAVLRRQPNAVDAVA